MDSNGSWRAAMIVPGVMFVLIAFGMKVFCWDTPTKPRFSTADTGKISKASMWDHVECLKDPRIDIMILQYGTCVGTELATNAQLATLPHVLPDGGWGCPGMMPMREGRGSHRSLSTAGASAQSVSLTTEGYCDASELDGLTVVCTGAGTW